VGNDPSSCVVLPKATWSLAELNLSSSRNPSGSTSCNDRGDDITTTTHNDSDSENLKSPMSTGELDQLAYRCLIDVHSLSSSQSDRLKSDLENIMRCVSIVTDANGTTSTTYNDASDGNNPTLAAHNSRGDDSEGGGGGGGAVRSRTEEIQTWGIDDRHEAETVLNRLRGSKMVQRRRSVEAGEPDDDWYFSLVTVAKGEEEDGGTSST